MELFKGKKQRGIQIPAIYRNISKINSDYTSSSDVATDSHPITAITLFVGWVPRCKTICIWGVDHGSFELQESYPLLLPATKAAINTKLDQN